MEDAERWAKIREISAKCKCPIITATQLRSKDDKVFPTKRINMVSSDGVKELIMEIGWIGT